MTVDTFFPIKNAALWLPKFLIELEHLEGINHVTVTYGNSTDDTLSLLKEWKDSTRYEVDVYSDPVMKGAVNSAGIAGIYRDYQKIVEENTSCSHALLLDSDLLKMPKNLVPSLLKHNKNIIAPYPYVYLHDKPCRLFYDTQVFRKDGYRFHPFKPPRNNGQILQLDSVGTCILVERKPFTETPYDNPYPHMRFCDESRMKGYTVWADPSTVVYHLDIQRLGLEPHTQYEVLEAMAKGDPDPYSKSDKTPFIKDGGDVVKSEVIYMDIVNAYIYGRVK